MSPGTRAAGLALLCLLAVPAAAGAHALVLESSPRAGEALGEPPARVLLRFNSRIEKRLSIVTITGPAGRPVPLPVAAPDPAPDRLSVTLPPLGPGRYIVRWKVLSADGHVSQGALRFSVEPR
jgi:methionine-rich copper-binding protein CopC